MSSSKYLQISFIFTLKIVASLSSVLMGVMITRIYGLEIMGMYTVSLTVINLAVLGSSWGLANSYITAFYDDNGQGNILAILAVNLVWSLILLPVVLWLGNWFGVGALSPILTVFIVYSILNSKASYLAIINKQVLNSAIDDIAKNCLPIIAITFTHFLLAKALSLSPIQEFIASYLFAGGTVLVIAVITVISTATPVQISPQGAIRYLRHKFLFLVRNGIPITISLVLVLLMTQADRLLLAKLSDGRSLGIYGIAQTAVNVLSYATQSTMRILSPEIAKLVRENRLCDISGVTRKYSVLLSIFGFIASAGAAALGNFYFHLYGLSGSEAQIGINVLVVLLLGQAVSNLFGFGITVATYSNNRKPLVFCQIMLLSIQITMCYLLIPTFGLIAAASITCITSILIKFLMWLYYKKQNIEVGVF